MNQLCHFYSIYCALSTADTIALFSAIGTWVAGLATVTAVIVSLWLAIYKYKISLKIWCGNIISINGPMPQGVNPECFRLKITNTTQRPITISQISCKTGVWKFGRQWAIFNMAKNYIPKTLAYGELIDIVLPLADVLKATVDLVEDNNQCINNRLKIWLRVKTLQFVIYTSTDEFAVGKPTRELIRKLFCEIKKRQQKV